MDESGAVRSGASPGVAASVGPVSVVALVMSWSKRVCVPAS